VRQGAENKILTKPHVITPIERINTLFYGTSEESTAEAVE
jgi:hypothetical protein